MDMSLSKFQESVMDKEAWRAGHDWVTELNWKESRERERWCGLWPQEGYGLVVEEGMWWINPNMDQVESTAEWK